MSSRYVSPPRRTSRFLTMFLAAAVATAVPALGAMAAHAGDAYFPPLAANDQYEVVQGESIHIPGSCGVLANDTLYDAGPLHVDATFDLLAEEGTVWWDGALDYTPDPSFVGTRTFTYQAIDEYSQMKSAVATVTITVTPKPNEAPIANPDSYNMVQGTTLHIDAPGVLANDTDPDGDTLTAIAAQGLPSSQLALNWSGWVTFIPDPTFTGTATFEYRISDSNNLLSDWATVTIVVSPKATLEPPIANPDTYTTPKDVPLTVSAPGVLANDSLPTGAIADWFDPANEVVLTQDGGFVYTPPKGFVGTKTFTYNMSANGSSDDVVSQSNWTTVTITVTDTTLSETGQATPPSTLALTGGNAAPALIIGGFLTAAGIMMIGITVWVRRRSPRSA